MERLFYRAMFLTLTWMMAQSTAFGLAEVKSSTVVHKSTVTMGDLFDNLDSGHDIWVMNSPAPGMKTTISTKYLASLTRQHQVYWQNSLGVRNIVVSREGKSVKHADLKYLIELEFESLNLEDRKSGIRIDTKNITLHLDEESGLDDITLEDFSFNRKTNKFSAKVSYPLGNNRYGTSLLRGRTYTVTYVPTLNKHIPTGQMIKAQDISWVSLPSQRLGNNVLRSKDQIIGMTPRRGMKVATPIKLSDLERPNIIKRGKIVSILFKSGKISLTAIGKAQESGGKGDVIRVMNNKSHKTIEAVITGPSQVQVITAHNAFALLNAQQ